MSSYSMHGDIITAPTVDDASVMQMMVRAQHFQMTPQIPAIKPPPEVVILRLYDQDESDSICPVCEDTVTDGVVLPCLHVVCGRDAADVALSTAFGVANLARFEVLTEEQAAQSSFNGRGAWWNAGAAHMHKAFPKKWGCKIVCVNGQSGVRQAPPSKRSSYGH